MQPGTIDFINAYCGELVASQFSESLVAQGLPAVRNTVFHQAVGSWNHQTREQAWAAAADLNEELQLGVVGEKFLLRQHVLTTGVGRVNGDFVVVTANPGHAPDPANAGEVLIRGTEQDNIDFGLEFFARFPAGVVGGRTHSWWRKVLRVARRLIEPPSQWNGLHTPQERWHWAYKQGGIGCIDLFPFHSTKDRLSHHAMRAGQECAQVALRQIANATLDMAIRAKPGVMLIASSLGASLVAQRGWQPVAVAQVNDRALTMYRINGVPIFVYAVQLFSGTVRGISNATLHGVADSMRELAASPHTSCHIARSSDR